MSNNLLCSPPYPTEEEMFLTPGIVAWKNLSLQYIGGSKNMIASFGFRDLDDLIGSTVYDIKCPMSECAEKFVAQDKIVIKERRQITVLDIHPFTDGEIKIILGNRIPLVDGTTNQVIGTIYNGIEINNKSIASLLYNIAQTDKFFYKQAHQRSYILNENNEVFLTKKENECLFYLIRGFTAKYISKQMKISNRTVESYTVSIKRKFNCKFKNELIEKAIQLGFLAYLPEKLLNKGISIEL